MLLEYGKCYKDRDGQKHGPLARTIPTNQWSATHPFQDPSSGVTWRADGRNVTDGDEWPLDLVEAVDAPFEVPPRRDDPEMPGTPAAEDHPFAATLEKAYAAMNASLDRLLTQDEKNLIADPKPPVIQRSFDEKAHLPLCDEEKAAMKALTDPTKDLKRFTRDELLSMHESTCNAAREIMAAKNRDYTGGGEQPDVFANFRSALYLGIEPELGLLMRCMDKFQRIRAFVTTGSLAVKTESADDAVQDVINYMILLKGLMRERANAHPTAL